MRDIHYKALIKVLKSCLSFVYYIVFTIKLLKPLYHKVNSSFQILEKACVKRSIVSYFCQFFLLLIATFALRESYMYIQRQNATGF